MSFVMVLFIKTPAV